MVKDLGFAAAVSTSAGAARVGDSLYQLPRFTPWDRTPARWGVRLARNLFTRIERPLRERRRADVRDHRHARRADGTALDRAGRPAAAAFRWNGQPDAPARTASYPPRAARSPSSRSTRRTGRLGRALRGVRALFGWCPSWRLRRAIGGADLVHVMANSGWAWHLFAAPALWIAWLRGVPVVVNYRGGDAERFLHASSASFGRRSHAPASSSCRRGFSTRYSRSTA